MESKLIPIAVLLLVIFVVLVIPMKITGYGFLPPDDALRHTAKAISAKDWGEILVLRSDIKMDTNPGWHAILGGVHRLTGWDQDGLAVFSIVVLSVLFCAAPLLFLERPEAWPLTLLVMITATPAFIYRLSLGRPYIFTMAVVLALGFLWPRLRSGKAPLPTLIGLAALAAISTWVHGSWYLFALPIICFFLVGEWRAGTKISICIIVGILVGAALTGRPFLFLKESLGHMLRAFGNHQVQRVLVGEFLPYDGNALMVIAVLGMLSYRSIRGAWDAKIVINPIFALAALSWVLGFVARRFWFDWGLPAIAVWLSNEFQEALSLRLRDLSWRRVLLAVAVGAALYISATSDINSRWTANLTTEYLSSEDPQQASWLPGPGGIIYSDDMGIFYQTFFKNPHAPWRYVLGFEPAMMPKDDLIVLRNIQWNFGAYEAFMPWVKKLRPEDRLIIRRPSDTPPKINGLEWNYVATGIWSGRASLNKSIK